MSQTNNIQNNSAKIACSNGYLVLKDIQWEGKKRMPIADFLRGYRPA